MSLNIVLLLVDLLLPKSLVVYALMNAHSTNVPLSFDAKMTFCGPWQKIRQTLCFFVSSCAVNELVADEARCCFSKCRCLGNKLGPFRGGA